MRVALQTGPRPAEARAREVEPARTQVTRAEIRGAIARALEKDTGARANERTVDVLTAHASLETASGDRMYNFNFAGIKGRSPSGGTAVLRTKEVLEGREVSIRDGFRAYGSLDEGALDYVRTMRTRFGGALEPAARGDLDGFAHSLKKSGYYTASEKDYAKGLASLAGAPHVALPSGKTLERAERALDADRWGTSLDSLPLSFSSPPARRAHRTHEAEEDD